MMSKLAADCVSYDSSSFVLMFRVLEKFLKVVDACLDFSLLFAGCVVFGILGEIPKLLGVFEVIGDFFAALGLQETEFLLEFSELFLA